MLERIDRDPLPGRTRAVNAMRETLRINQGPNQLTRARSAPGQVLLAVVQCGRQPSIFTLLRICSQIPGRGGQEEEIKPSRCKLQFKMKV